jgi:hypothetical protein
MTVNLEVVFQAPLISGLQYAPPASCGFVTNFWKNKIDSSIMRALIAPGEFCDLVNFDILMSKVDEVLFKAKCLNNHCLYSLLPASKVLEYELRPTGHKFQLPNFSTTFHKKSFVMRQ